MSTPGPAAKRRRVDAATSALHKPFRSPLKSANPATPAPPKTPRTWTPSGLAHSASYDTSTPDTEREVEAQHSPHAPSNSVHTPIRARPNNSRPTARPHARFSAATPIASSLHSSSPTGTKPESDPSIQTAQATIKALEHRARDLRTQISILTQASSLPSSFIPNTSHAKEEQASNHLEALTCKWRAASQAAAEVVFDDVYARIKDQGGMSTYRKAERERASENEAWLRGGFDDGSTARNDAAAGSTRQEDKEDNWRDEMGDVLTEAGKERRREEKRGLRDKYGGAAGDEDEGLNDDEDDDSFTMTSMLDMLHVDYDTIGYDKKQQRWMT